MLQARILEWVAIPFSRGSSQLRDGTQVSCIAGGFFTSWAAREAQKKKCQTLYSQDKECWNAYNTGQHDKAVISFLNSTGHSLCEQELFALLPVFHKLLSYKVTFQI